MIGSLHLHFLRLLCTSLLLLSLRAAAAPISPTELRYRGYVNDFADVIEPEWEQRLTRLITLLDQKTKAQIAVVTVSTLEGEPIEDFANRLFQAWKIGHKDDRGVLLLLVIKDRRSRLEVGYGLEPIIPDGYAGSVLREMRPALREQKYGQAIYAGVSLLAERIAAQSGVKLEELGVPRARPRAAQGLEWTMLPLVLALMPLLFLVLLAFWAPGTGVRYRRRRWWDSGYLGGFGGYDSSGSGGGFGGFEGFGGGSSGGGGASSSW